MAEPSLAGLSEYVDGKLLCESDLKKCRRFRSEFEKLTSIRREWREVHREIEIDQLFDESSDAINASCAEGKDCDAAVDGGEVEDYGTGSSGGVGDCEETENKFALAGEMEQKGWDDEASEYLEQECNWFAMQEE